jgi:hypothetical protein
MNVPVEYRADLHKAVELIEGVEKTHVSLSRLAIFSALCDIANRAVLVNGIAGTGKSTVANFVGINSTRNVLRPHGITVNGLSVYAKALTQNSYTIICEDLSRSGTDYAQFATVSVLSGLVYSGFVSKHTQSLHLDIHDFTGSALIYTQPLIMRKIVAEPEFESDIRDKCLRYYHLHKPVQPRPEPLNIKISWSSLDRYNVKLELSVESEKFWKGIIENFKHIVSHARALEHALALIKASAVLNRRDKVTKADLWLVNELTRNFRLEKYLFVKRELEGPRELDVNVLPILTVLRSYGKRKLSELAFDFQLSERRLYQILENMGYWVLVNAKTVYPTKAAKKVLAEIGEVNDHGN